MANNTLADVDGISTVANHTATKHGELKAHINGLVGCQSDLFTAYKGQTGDAIYSSLGETVDRGTNLARQLWDVVEAMKDAGVQFNAADDEQRGLVAGAQEDYKAGDHSALGESNGPVYGASQMPNAPKVDLNY